MFETNQSEYQEMRKFVRNNWSRISEEDFASTQGDLHRIAELIASKYAESAADVSRKLEDFRASGNKAPVTEKSESGIVVDSSEPESQEWNARESVKERGSDIHYE